MGGRIIGPTTKGRGPYNYKIGGQNHHLIGTLLPADGARPKFSELYIYDTEDEIKNRKTAARSDGRTYNLPTTSEVAALIVGDIDSADKRDIIIETKGGKLQQISELHPSYLAMQYPLLFPYGEDGFRTDIMHRDKTPSAGSTGKRFKLTMREFFAYRIQDRALDAATILLSRRLLQQFLVDAYTMIEAERLSFLRHNQQSLRAANVKNLRGAVERGETEGSSTGSRIVLPSSFTGGHSYMRENYQDAMAICRWYGYPDLFITFTLVYTVEFQKRGLPHAHILLFMHQGDKYPVASDIDKIICAELPDKSEDPELYQAVSEYMMHGPCGSANTNAPCMIDKQCSKHFPKRFNDATKVDDEGYPVYRRRDNGSIVEKSGVHLDNRYVVPYNAELLRKYQGHINVEWCNQSRSIKYLFKYINKGYDRVTTAAYQDKQKEGEAKEIDEIKMYYDCRYISACEAIWRIFGFSIHYRTPAVERLSFHLPGEQTVLFNDHADVESAQREWTPRSKGVTIGRIYHVSPGSGEKFYLRTLLNFVKGATCYEDIRTVDGLVYPTFKEACYARGLLDDDKEYVDAITEASFRESGYYLRHLFSMLLLSGSMSKPEEVWHKTWQLLSDDILYKQRCLQKNKDLHLTDDQIESFALAEIETMLQSNGSSLRRFSEMPFPDELIIKKGEIVLPVASSGIASLLLPRGRTAHSRFGIPLNVNENSTCAGIRPGSELADLLIKTKLIIWDEAPMMHKYCFEALDRSLRDIMRSVDRDNLHRPFGGKVVVFGGDLRQILPVVPKGSRQDIVFATVNSSYLWDSCKVLRLTRNMRLQSGSSKSSVDELREFSEWILSVGDGNAGGPNDGEAVIEIAKDILIDPGDIRF
ncbi:uncharacterized protein LOC125493694 [Beta vulgaris subsp. vulgaris]|uniref:uncharacterized protein LOC125493694 n=1 Tax=Beta vulgaris subsp. vulgaris TaxID=3555 RepID=UPI0025467250|nr:uncharacterized protein LOC125493694 [Beta vulgaris subsp. vulgaris]